MDNISFYCINRRKQAWKAGQSKGLPGLFYCRFFVVYADNCQARAPPFSIFGGAGITDSERKKDGRGKEILHIGRWKKI